MECIACRLKIESLLCGIPSKWREQLVNVICDHLHNQQMDCSKFVACLSDEMTTLDYQCLVETQAEWDALTFLGKIQKIIDRVCQTLEDQPIQVEDSFSIELVDGGDSSDPLGSLTNPLQANLLLDEISASGNNIASITTNGLYVPPTYLDFTLDDLNYNEITSVILNETMTLSLVSPGTVGIGSIPITIDNFEKDVQLNATGDGDHTLSAEIVIASSVPYDDNILQSIAGGLGLYVPPTQPKPTVDHFLFSPTNGGTVNLQRKTYNIINPVGALSSVTFNLPATTEDGDYVEVKFTKIVTTLTWTGGTLVFNPTSGAQGTYIKLVYDSDTLTWY